MSFTVVRHPGFKIAGIALLALLMLIPLVMVRELVSERQQRQRDAQLELARQWGGQQQLAPLYLVTSESVSKPVDASGNFIGNSVRKFHAADEATVDGVLDTDVRHRGMFDIPVYTGVVKVQAKITAAALREALRGADPSTPPVLALAIADAQGIQRLDALTVDGVPAQPNADGIHFDNMHAITIATPAGVAIDGTRDIAVTYALHLAGTQSLAVLPLAPATRVTLRGDWPHPSYVGAYLPRQHELRDGAFTATWETSALNGAYRRQFASLPVTPGHFGTTAPVSLGVALYQPVDAYQQTERSVKYGLLVIALVFTAMFLFEIIAGLLLHPIQYLLVGLALAMFYLLLLALAEHAGFGLAYLAAGAGATLLVTGYATAAMRSTRRGVMLGALQAIAYGLFYGLVRSEDNALLLGASALFIALAMVMYLTRRTDWYALGTRPAPMSTPASTPA